MILNGTALARFWPKVDKSDECWVWTARLDRHGYGKFRPNGAHTSEVGAHRVSYAIEHGAIPAGRLVLHHCDNRRCVRPSHLYAGTPAQNTADMDNRGRRVQGNIAATAARGMRNAMHNGTARRRYGADNHATRLTVETVLEIRAAFAGGETQGSIGRRLGVPQPHISRIVLRTSWAHVA